MDVLRGFGCLLVCQALGELIARALPAGFPVGLPSPVIGMLILMAALSWAPVRVPVAAAANALLAHLSLLFVPVGVGVMTHMDLVSRYGLKLVAVLLLSTWAGLAVAALVLRGLLRSADAPAR